MMGERTTIVVSSPRRAKLVLHTNGLAKLFCYNNLGTTFAKYGEYLKQLRQLYMLELLSPKRVKSFWGIFEDELEKLVGSIRSEAGKEIVIID
ncbi:hypothetical protein M9H77_13504 [Catharanthus roseus]|uniref:Uncharacterized protein n=1 Tax=Catharanthus roseus TaxID=4058 RepID=A0ACC0BKI5_CATRO|nr:hypothetical protein M9H77_13504 [Catharanthus roseus]